MEGEGAGFETKAFTDSLEVSRGVVRDAHKAVESAALLSQAETLYVKVKVADRATLRGDILKIAISLQYEIETAAEKGAQWATEISDRWETLLPLLEMEELESRQYQQLALDISTATFELGYTDVRYTIGENESASADPRDGEILDMFEEMELQNS